MKLVLVIISSLRADHVSLYGNRWLATDHFSALGQAGRFFTQARCRCPEARAVRLELLTGLSARRFDDAGKALEICRCDFTLPGLLKSAGYRTALFTDNFHLRPLYDSMTAFDTVYFVPGQGADRHVSEGFVESGDPLSPDVVSGAGRRPDPDEVARYLRNRGVDAQRGHPSERLFEAAADHIKTRAGENSFTLIDSYGLAPPWDPPRELGRYRRPDDFVALAWPVAGPVDPADPAAQELLNFLRRAYADGCLFADHLLGKLPADPDQILIVMSDHGILIGDEGRLLAEPERPCPALVNQVLIVQSPRFKAAGARETPVYPEDLFATLILAACPNVHIGGDGKAIDELLT